ncbi:HGxxPAAW family protein [Angustibacter sp. Root456]|uniref:HGxxPAAW family protein n=1 Tax=Angustibacter sp. Root456 TaxID=1736539 RepID=UPI0006FB0BB5|nr:HGxxPAAW family protein [Angustibacter sp. Root456]KQX66653.1 anthranilate synthase [Angustibacter sp. Root456]
MAEHGHPSHGNTVAAWTAVGILLVAALVMAFGVILASVVVFVIGAVIAVLGLVAGKVLALAGYGAAQPAQRQAHEAR